MKESFEEIVNILENRYKSYSPHHYDMFNLLANLINTNDLIKNIDESLKKYYNLKKSYLKTKVDYL